MRHTIAFAVGVLLSLPVAGQAKTLYVDRAAGNDATTYAANSSSAPWASIGRAAWGSTSRSAPNTSQAAQPGDIVIVNAGTYATPGLNNRWEVAYNAANSGTAGSPITFRSNGRVTLQLSSGTGPVIGCQGRNYITWDGFYIDEANARPAPDTGSIVVHVSNGCVIQNNEVNGIYVDYGGQQDNHNGVRVEASNGTVVRGNRIYEIGVMVSGTNVRNSNQAAVMLYDSNDTIIEGNEFFDIGTGVYVKGQHSGLTQRRTIIRQNLVYRAEHAGFVLGPAAYQGRTYQNIVRDSTTGVKLMTLTQGVEGGNPMYEVVANNTINNCESGIMLQGKGVGNGIYNNLVTNNRTSPINNWVDNEPRGVAFNYNMYFNYRVFGEFASMNLSFDTWRNTYGLDASSRNQINPLYVNLAAQDFRLQAGSPARTGGIDVLDLNRNGSTSDQIPVGAYVTGSEIIGLGGSGTTVATGVPSPPTGVRVTTGS